jgi:hypothetical protein
MILPLFLKCAKKDKRWDGGIKPRGANTKYTPPRPFVRRSGARTLNLETERIIRDRLSSRPKNKGQPRKSIG